MHAMATSTYPLTSTNDVGKAFVESVKDVLPDFMKRIGVYSVYGGKGIKVYALYEIANDHADEGLKELVNRQLRFKSIEGYEVNLEWMLTAEESLPMIGL